MFANRKLFLTSLVAGGFIAACSGSSGTPKAASGLTVAPLSGGAHLIWTDNSNNETEFLIERKSGAGAYSMLASVPFNTTAYHDGTIVSGMTYTYHVIANSAAGRAEASNEESITGMSSGDMATAVDMGTGSAACHQVGCRAFSSFCSTASCTCIGVISDNPDPVCTGTMVSCTIDPCQGKTASCNHGTGKCVVQ